MDSKILFFSVIITVAISPIAQCDVALHEVPVLQENSTITNSTVDLKISKEEFVQKYPEVVNWFQRAIQRMKEGKNATSDDLLEAKAVMNEIREHIYEFVTSPIFFFTTDIFIDKIVNSVAPVLGVFPIKELKELIALLGKNPGLSKLLFEDKKVDAVQGFNELDQWFLNNTVHIFVEQGVDKVAPTNGTSILLQ